MRTPAESKEVAEVFNLDPSIVKEYVQFGSVFNLLHAGASYLRKHQRGFGAVGVSKKYGDRSFARYPIFWGLPKIGQLPNPDPADTAEWNRDEQNKMTNVTIDEEKESKRGELRKQAQVWAGLDVDPDAELFVFVGRWSLQKGVDLIADIFPSILEKHPSTQLIAVGPCVDLYGRFAALKLEKLTKKYPGRVYSKPEFTALPPYVFSGAEFALIPSRDEPFGLVAVEFGSKGALGVGARVGGLGQSRFLRASSFVAAMLTYDPPVPGFWYTIESTATSHLLHQFRGSIVAALESKHKTRVLMRAWSSKQRFPVKQWLEDLETLQSKAIRLHEKDANKRKRFTHNPLLTVPSRNYDSDSSQPLPRPSSAFLTRPTSAGTPSGRSRASSLYQDSPPPTSHRSRSPSQPPQLHISGPAAESDDVLLRPNPLYANANPFYTGSTNSSSESLSTMINHGHREQAYDALTADAPADERPSTDRPFLPGRDSSDSFAYRIMAPNNAATLTPPLLRPGMATHHRNSSLLSVNEVVGSRTYNLQKVDPFFNDSTGEYYRAFEEKLAGLTAKNSESEMCIEEYLVESERDWSKRFRNAKLGRSRSPGARRSMDGRGHSRNSSYNSIAPSEAESDDRADMEGEDFEDDEFLLGKAYKPPTGLKK